MSAKIEAVRARWIDATNEGSADDFVGCVTHGAVWLPPRGDPVEGRDAVREWLRPLFEQFRYDFSIGEAHVRRVGDWAVEEATFRTVLHPREAEGGGALEHDGRYLLLWRRTADGWLIDRYVDRTEQSVS